ncbi:Peptide chain release factor RF2 [Candidatus Erwinia haradaeae]|uniref:Peptide chain release factor 2 n=1 Tax=Candidatus Erwinia haradaeae TaxID=1922217 RepID=A0A451DD13_9GAMM|nr:peptide chain release factor 2 [Candidatus Erwinia haradaeae]VFP84325.1 Peptide chain release factor RF2 [Candidatus Erwinia haradaeae]
MCEIHAIKNHIQNLIQRNAILKNTLHYTAKTERLQEIHTELERSDIWNQPDRAQALGKERSSLLSTISTLQQIQQELEEISSLFVLTLETHEQELYNDMLTELNALDKQLRLLEFQCMFQGKHMNASCYIDIQAGSGGIEAQDWASMLLRMYIRSAEAKGFQTEIIEESLGDIAGTKSATIKIIGNYAYGWFRTESGIHRLVRKSPFDSGGRRHTSFSSVFIYPDIDENIELPLNPADLRIDVYRSSGAGGQHVNKTESAVRITHLPTNIVVQCQSDRSQHKNKDQAFKQLRAKLYEYTIQKKKIDQKTIEENKSEITWGHQIRSYVLDDSRIKDLRTNIETRNTQEVLDGYLDRFIEASLKAGL